MPPPPHQKGEAPHIVPVVSKADDSIMLRCCCLLCFSRRYEVLANLHLLCIIMWSLNDLGRAKGLSHSGGDSCTRPS
eukprot:scaffold1940_cov228-Ochromonas_danica.AAC.5